MISPKDVSVVVQGPWHAEFTPRCLASIAEALPGAEVILSVWKGDPAFPAHEAGAHTVLLNGDPGATDIAGLLDPELERRTAITNTNLNRQIVSSRNGLRLAGRPYALKLRSDMVVEHAGFLAHADLWRGVPGPLRAFRERIVTLNARSPRRSFCFFVQDFCSFGLTEDMLRLWESEPIPSREALLALPAAERNARVLVPEQHLLLAALRRHAAAIPMRNALDTSPELVELTEKAIAGNLVCLDVRRFGVRTLKPSLAWVNDSDAQRYSWLWILKASYGEFLGWCRRHCDWDFSRILEEAGGACEADQADVSVKDSLILGGGALNADHLLALGEREHRLGNLGEAQNAYVTLLRANYRTPKFCYLMGVLQVQRGDPESGIANIQLAIRMAPDFLPAYESLANHYRGIGDHAAAAHWAAELERRRRAS